MINSKQERTIMKSEERKDFDKEAAQWDANPGRVKLAGEVADAIIREINPTPDLDALDFGCGTGLVTLKLQPFVKTITGVDSSRGMLGALQEKVRAQGLTNVRALLVDFEQGGRVEGTYDLLVSSMTLHHVADTAVLFTRWLELLRPGGRVCFADLDTEDGSFHGDNTGVLHFGFDREQSKRLLREAGCRDVRDITATRIVREAQGKEPREFSVFLIIGRK
ncbi:MAG TPA: class I SAM-dependent methyltransferase [Nitrospirota bacterium]